MKPYEIHRKINWKYGLSLSTLHQLDVFWVNTGDIFEWTLDKWIKTLVLSLQWKLLTSHPCLHLRFGVGRWLECWHFVSHSGFFVVQCFRKDPPETPYRYVCQHICKKRSQKRKGLIICKKMNQTWSFKYSDLLIAHDFLPFPRPSYGKKNPDAQFDLLHVDGGHQLGAYPAMIFAAEKRLITRGACGNCMAMLNILDIEIYRFTINRFRAFALRYQQALRDLQNCSGAQILVVGRWELPWR